MKPLFIGIIVGILAITFIIGYVVMKEKQIRQLEDELAIAESQPQSDTLDFDLTSIVIVADSAKIQEQERRIKWLRGKLQEYANSYTDSTISGIEIDEITAVLDSALSEPCNKVIEFDSTI
ncbi:MAG TPA: hypothetical protein ENK70_07515, partial [Methylophaga sp.]|nr:hypothetical protein [Methylophaga sp.]